MPEDRTLRTQHLNLDCFEPVGIRDQRKQPFSTFSTSWQIYMHVKPCSLGV